MPRFRTGFHSGLLYAPKNVKMCSLASGASWGSGYMLCQSTDTHDDSTQYYGSTTGRVEQDVPRATKVLATDVATYGIVTSGASHDFKLLGAATKDAPTSYLQTASPVELDQWFQNTSVFENLLRFGYVNQEPIWMPYSGTNPVVGDWVTLSSGSDGYVEVVADPYDKIIVGKVILVASGSEGPQVWTDTGIVEKCAVDLAYRRGW